MLSLFIGDCHVVQDELEDCQKLADLIYDTVVKYKPDNVIFLGDQFHNFSQVNVEVLHFWRVFLLRLSEWDLNSPPQVFLLVGNHDRSHDRFSHAHALNGLKGLGSNTHIVDEGWGWSSDARLYPFDFIPFKFTAEEFFTKEYGGGPGGWSSIIVAHQAFNGMKYESGKIIDDGFDLKQDLPFIISGHIHTPQESKKVWYPGAPRWRSLSDANVDRAIWMVETEEGVIKSRIPISTDCCRRIWSYGIHENEIGVGGIQFNNKDLYHFNIEGSKTFVEEQRAWIANQVPNHRMHTKITDKAIKIKESDGLDVSFYKYLDSYKPKFNTPKKTLGSMAKERIQWTK